MASRNRGSAAGVVDAEVSLVVSSADIDVVNTAIVGLANEKPADRRGRMLYERWAAFAASPARQRSDQELDPVLRAFASTYRAARGDASGRMAELAGAPVSLEVAGKQLDVELARIMPAAPSSSSSSAAKSPWLLLGGAGLAWFFLRKKGGRRK